MLCYFCYLGWKRHTLIDLRNITWIIFIHIHDQTVCNFENKGSNIRKASSCLVSASTAVWSMNVFELLPKVSTCVITGVLDVWNKLTFRLRGWYTSEYDSKLGQVIHALRMSRFRIQHWCFESSLHVLSVAVLKWYFILLIKCFLFSISKVETTVTDNSDGSYSVSYTPQQPGAYSVWVCVKAQHVKVF